MRTIACCCLVLLLTACGGSAEPICERGLKPQQTDRGVIMVEVEVCN